jgi:hypothetical protein
MMRKERASDDRRRHFQAGRRPLAAGFSSPVAVRWCGNLQNPVSLAFRGAKIKSAAGAE